MNQAKKSEPAATPAPVEVAAPEAPTPKKKTPGLDWAFHALKYGLWPQFIQKYRVYKKWAEGNEDRQDSARKKFWTVFAFCFGISFCWWIVFALSRGWSIHSTLDTFRFVLFVWIFGCIPMNIYCVGFKKQKGVFSIPDWKKYLESNGRLHWTEFPEACLFIQPKLFEKVWHRIRHGEKLLPTKRDTTFTLGTDGTSWIKYGWYGGKVEYIKTGRFVFGDPSFDPENGLRGLMAFAATEDTIFICADGNPFSGVSFRHLKHIPNCLIYEDRESIIKAVKWLHREMGRRRDGGKYPRIVLVCDQTLMDAYAPGYWVEAVKQMFYHWHEIRNEMIDILKYGSRHNIFIVGIVEPSDRMTSMQSDWIPYVFGINFYYYQPVTNERGTIWVAPHPNHYTDVFSVMNGDDRIIGKFPYVPENEMVALLQYFAERETEETRALRVKARIEIPAIDNEPIAKKEEYQPLWKRIGMKNRPVEIKPGDLPIEQGATEEFYQLHHAPKDGTNGNTNGKQNGKSAQQEELELQKN